MKFWMLALAALPTALGDTWPAPQIREVTLELVRRAVIKGFARLEAKPA